MSPTGLLKLFLATALAMTIAATVAFIVFDLEEYSPVTEEDAKAALTALRRSILNGNPVTRVDGKEIFEEQIPVVVTVWKDGRRRSVYQADGDQTIAEALWDIAKDIRSMDLRAPMDARLQVDFVVATGWVPQGGVLASLAFVEGHDGVSANVGGRRIYLPPTELIRGMRYGTFRPLPDLERKFKIGIELEKVGELIAEQAERIGVRVKTKDVEDFARFRSVSVVEGADLGPRLLTKGTVERPGPTRQRVRASVIAGADYLRRALKESGTYRYHYNPVWDRKAPGGYNWPRHAGATYSLALVGRILKKSEYFTAARAALERFEKQLGQGPQETVCLESRGSCYLGSSALGLLALAEYRIASADTRFDENARRLAAFLKIMQRPDGFFYHSYDPQGGIDKDLMKLYASSQAVFALARFARAYEDEEALAAARKGMDFLAGPYWDHFLGNFFFGQEHWTCLAAEEVYAAVPKEAYAKLCYAIGIHYDNITLRPDETPFLEDVGGMSVTHLFTPHVGGTATAAEAMVSALALGRKIGVPTSELDEQLVYTLGFLLRGQVTPNDTFWMPQPLRAVGGFFETQAKPRIRIDHVQHAISAMVRSLETVTLEE